MNSVAGGGSFLSFPALLFAGVAPISANATNNAAMWVGTIGSARGFHEEISEHRALLLPVVTASIAGSLIGACLLLATPQTLFVRLIPWLLLFATSLFAVSPLLQRKSRGAPRHAPWQIALQFAVAVYGGYFGAGMGIMMLAVLAFSGLPSLNAQNAIKTCSRLRSTAWRLFLLSSRAPSIGVLLCRWRRSHCWADTLARVFSGAFLRRSRAR